MCHRWILISFSQGHNIKLKKQIELDYQLNCINSCSIVIMECVHVQHQYVSICKMCVLRTYLDIEYIINRGVISWPNQEVDEDVFDEWTTQCTICWHWGIPCGAAELWVTFFFVQSSYIIKIKIRWDVSSQFSHVQCPIWP